MTMSQRVGTGTGKLAVVVVVCHPEKVRQAASMICSGLTRKRHGQKGKHISDEEGK